MNHTKKLVPARVGAPTGGSWSLRGGSVFYWSVGERLTADVLWTIRRLDQHSTGPQQQWAVDGVLMGTKRVFVPAQNTRTGIQTGSLPQLWIVIVFVFLFVFLFLKTIIAGCFVDRAPGHRSTVGSSVDVGCTTTRSLVFKSRTDDRRRRQRSASSAAPPSLQMDSVTGRRR